MPDVIDGNSIVPYVRSMKKVSGVTLEAGIFVKESATSGKVTPFTSSTDLCIGVSAEHVYSNEGTHTLTTDEKNVRVILTSFVGYMRAEATTYNNGDLLYASTTGTLTKTAGGPVRAVYFGEDGVTVRSGGYLGPVYVRLPNKRTSTSDIGWGATDF